MKKLNLALCLLFFVGVIQAQVGYTVSPANTINLTLPLNQTTASKIYQVNTDSSKILLKWERVFVNLPVGWIYTSYDNSACYGGIPAGPMTMDSIPVSAQSFVGLDIDPTTISGVGIVKIYVYQDGYYSQGDTLTWNISTAAVGVNEYTDSDKISLYPNPSTDVLNIQFKEEYKDSKVRITDAVGRKVMEEEITGALNTIDVSNLPAGNYFLLIESKERVISKRFIKR